MDLSQVPNILFTGLTAGAIYGLLALSYNVVFATTGVLNFAQGELFMLGAVFGAFLLTTQISLAWAGVAFLIAVLVAVVASTATERIAVRPALKLGSNVFGWVISTLGISLILRAGVGLIFGADTKNFPTVLPNVRWQVLGTSVTPTQVLLVAVFVVLGIFLAWMYRRTGLGRALSAVAQDREAAAIRGIPVERMAMISFAMAGAIAGLAGFLGGPITAAYPALGLVFGLKGFVAAAVGGMPTIRGAVGGGIILGLVESTGVYFFGAGYQNVVVFALLLLILLIKPAGLFGRRAARSI